MQIFTVQDDWGDASIADINELLRDTASHLERLLGEPFDGIIYVKP